MHSRIPDLSKMPNCPLYYPASNYSGLTQLMEIGGQLLKPD